MAITKVENEIKDTNTRYSVQFTGVADDDQNLLMLYRNKSSPDCCPSTFTTSTGSVCTTDEQRNYLNRRGMVSSK